MKGPLVSLLCRRGESGGERRREGWGGEIITKPIFPDEAFSEPSPVLAMSELR